MLNLIKLVLISYSMFYRYETPTYSGNSSLFSQNVWYMPVSITQSGYRTTITITGIIPYSSKDLKHSSVSLFHRLKNIYVFGGARVRKLSNLYTETTTVMGGVLEIKNVSLGANLRAITENLINEKGILKATLDLSVLYHHRFLQAGFSLFNVVRPVLTFSQETRSKTAQRGLVTLNYPSSVYFTLGYEKGENYETPFVSTEVWFTKGFNVVFGIENNTVEGGIALRSTHSGIGFRVKSHTIMGPTYIAYVSFYRE